MDWAGKNCQQDVAVGHEENRNNRKAKIEIDKKGLHAPRKPVIDVNAESLRRGDTWQGQACGVGH